MNEQDIKYYLDRYTEGTITQEEWNSFRQFLRQPSNVEKLEAYIEEQMGEAGVGDTDYSTITEEVMAGVIRRIQQDGTERNSTRVHRIQKSPGALRHPLSERGNILKTAWFKYAAAVLLIFGIGAYLWNIQQKEKPLITTTKPVPVKNDVAPGGNKATLTLSDGSTVLLDSAASELINDGSVGIKNIDGVLRYEDAAGTPLPAGRQASPGDTRSPDGSRLKAGAGVPTAYNMMTTPKGGQYKLTLSDGTNVWLNAASSITYPTVFVSNRREVTISGEAYFEVKKDASKPFFVNTPKESITVLGTSFNVNAYADESAMKTSLLEGSVRVGEKVLKPGQALVNGKVIATNVEQDVAWKNGLFNFNGMSLAQVMRLIERWYDVKVTYEKNIPNRKIGGEMGRDLTLAQVLEGFTDLNIHYRLEGRQLIIQP